MLCVLATQAGDLYNGVSAFVQSGKLSEAWEKISSSFLDEVLRSPLLSGVDIKGMVVKGISDLSSGLAAQLGGLLKNSVILAIDIVIMLIALFFFFGTERAITMPSSTCCPSRNSRRMISPENSPTPSAP